MISKLPTTNPILSNKTLVREIVMWFSASGVVGFISLLLLFSSDPCFVVLVKRRLLRINAGNLFFNMEAAIKSII